MQICHYLSASGADPFQLWLDGLPDLVARNAILRRVNHLQLGHSGSRRYCREGVHELRIDLGPGYRVCYGLEGRDIAVLLGGGSKRTQDRDIEKAVRRWQDHRRRSE